MIECRADLDLSGLLESVQDRLDGVGRLDCPLADQVAVGQGQSRVYGRHVDPLELDPVVSQTQQVNSHSRIGKPAISGSRLTFGLFLAIVVYVL